MRVVRTHSLQTRPASGRRAWSGPRHNVALCAASGRRNGPSAVRLRRITDTMPVPASAALSAPRSRIDLVPKSLTCRIASERLRGHVVARGLLHSVAEYDCMQDRPAAAVCIKGAPRQDGQIALDPPTC